MDKTVRTIATVSLAVVLVIPFDAAAEFLAPFGPELSVPDDPTGHQGTSFRGGHVASRTDGTFVVVWDGNRAGGDDGGVSVRLFDGFGVALGDDFQANTYTTGAQREPAVAAHADGSFVVVWDDYADVNSVGIFGQRFDAVGTALGTEFQVNSYTTSIQNYPRVATTGAGSFIVAWVSFGQDAGGANSRGVYAQRFDASGVPSGTEFRVNTSTSGDQDAPSVAGRSDGSFLVVWSQSDGDTIDGQHYDAAGLPSGAEFSVSGSEILNRSNPEVTAIPGGGFVSAWASEGQDGALLGVFGQRLDASAAKVGPEFQVNSYTLGSQFGPSIAVDGDDSFLITWSGHRNQDGDGWGVFAQRFDAVGDRAGTEFRVNSYTPLEQRRSSVASDGGGTFLVAWEETRLISGGISHDGSGSGVFAQVFKRDSALATLCGASPQVTCRDAGKSKVKIRSEVDARKNQLSWSWASGDLASVADFADPVGGVASYSLCVYDGSGGGQPLREYGQAPGGVCGVRPCWKAKGSSGFRFTDRARDRNGVSKQSFKSNTADKAKVVVKAKRENLDAPSLPLTLPVTVQMLIDDGGGTPQCWRSVFTAASSNAATSFQARTP